MDGRVMASPLEGSLKQQKISNPKAGSSISASYPLAAICASYQDNGRKYFVHFLPPADAGGYAYKIAKTKEFERETLHFVATDGNTVVHFSGNNSQVPHSFSDHFILQHAGTSAEMDITSHNNDSVYSFLSNKPIHIMAQFKQNVSGSGDGMPFNSDGYNFVHVPHLSSSDPSDGRSIADVLDAAAYSSTSNSGWPQPTTFTSRNEVSNKAYSTKQSK
jgi:hypothetical protein